MATPPPLPPGEAQFKLTRSEIFPLVGGRSTWKQEHLLPIFVTLIVGIALFAVPFPWPQLTSNGKPVPVEINEAWQVYFDSRPLHRLHSDLLHQSDVRPRQTRHAARVGRAVHVPDVGQPVLESLVRAVLQCDSGGRSGKNPTISWRSSPGTLFGTGLCEEGFKAWPLFLLVLVGAGLGFLSRRSKGRLSRVFARARGRYGLCEPLNGIVLGVASGGGFFIAETLGQYLPNAMNAEKYAGSQAFNGLVLLLARGLPELAEHSAWCGLFGYFIGLSVLQPRMAVFLLPLGWLSAAALHGAWDGIGAVTSSGSHRCASVDRRRRAELRLARRSDFQGARYFSQACLQFRDGCEDARGKPIHHAFSSDRAPFGIR